jgi:hypothetical protein
MAAYMGDVIQFRKPPPFPAPRPEQTVEFWKERYWQLLAERNQFQTELAMIAALTPDSPVSEQAIESARRGVSPLPTISVSQHPTTSA